MKQMSNKKYFNEIDYKLLSLMKKFIFSQYIFTKIKRKKHESCMSFSWIKEKEIGT